MVIDGNLMFTTEAEAVLEIVIPNADIVCATPPPPNLRQERHPECLEPRCLAELYWASVGSYAETVCEGFLFQL